MPLDSMLVSAAVLSMFVVFAGALLWVDFQSGPVRPQQLGRDAKRRRI
jgi:hypothetical protein